MLWASCRCSESCYIHARHACSFSIPDTSLAIGAGRKCHAITSASSSFSHLWGRHHDCLEHPLSYHWLSETLRLVPRVFDSQSEWSACRKISEEHPGQLESAWRKASRNQKRFQAWSRRRKSKKLIYFFLRLGDSSSLLFICRGE